MASHIDLAAIAATPDLAALPALQAEIVRAERLWAVAARVDRNPCDDLARRFGSNEAARHFVVLMALAVAAWPEPFRVHPPCCPRVCYYEKLIADMVARAAAGDRAGFHALIEDMLPGDIGERLFAAACWFAEAMAGKVTR